MPTFTGITLADQQNMVLTELQSNQAGSGIKVTKMAGETLAFGDVVYMKSDAKVWKADADVAGTYPAVGMAMGAITANQNGIILLIGIVRNDAWAWTIGGVLYLSTTAGAMTQTQPSATDDAIQTLGIAHPNADTVWFNPSLDYLTHV